VHSGRASTQNLPVVAGEAGFSAWFPGWLRHAFDNPYDLAIPLALALAGIAAAVVLAARTPIAGRQRGAGAWWLLLPLGAAVLAWFSVAPEPRYASPYFWTLAALGWSQAFRRRLTREPPPALRPILVAGALLGLSPALINPVFSREFAERDLPPLEAILKANLNRPGGDLWFQPIQGQPRLSTYRTRSGLLLNTVPDRCWDAPLPCTPNPAPNLRLRDSTEPAKGFVVDGEWQMENWPMSWQPGFLSAWRRGRARVRP